MSSRCESVESVHLVHEVLWDAMQMQHDWLGIFTALVQDYLSENFSRELLFFWSSKASFQLSNYDLIFADKYLNTWTTVKSN